MLAGRVGQGRNLERVALDTAAAWGGSAAGGSAFTSLTDDAGYGPFGGSSVRLQGTNANGGTVDALLNAFLSIAPGQSIEMEVEASIATMVNGILVLGIFCYDSASGFLNLLGSRTLATLRRDRVTISPTDPLTVKCKPLIRAIGSGAGGVDASFDVQGGVVR
jgi:hypothetical protein